MPNLDALSYGESTQESKIPAVWAPLPWMASVQYLIVIKLVRNHSLLKFN